MAALLSVLERRPGSNQSMLARALAFDKTTLSRNLALMQRKGWIEHAGTDDLRERGFYLTAAGRKLLVASQPHWRRAQNRLRAVMAKEQWDAVWSVFRNVTNLAYQAGSQKRDKP